MTDYIEIRPHQGFSQRDLRDLWAHRELVWFLGWRDVQVRYKQTTFGALWAVLQPLALMAVFAIFLGRLAKVPSDGLSYPLFVLAGLVPWNYASQAVDGAAHSVVNNSQLVSKTYFPRLALPIAALGAPLIDMAIAAALFAVACLVLGDGFSADVIWAPAFLAMVVFASLGIGIWLAALNVRYRDVRFVIRFALQLWLFLTPVAYPLSLIPERWQTIYALNPLVGPVAGFRWATVGGDPIPAGMILTSSVVAVALLIAGVAYFRSTERSFADVI